MTDRTITFRGNAVVTFSDTITNDVYFATLLEEWDECGEADRRDMIWDSYADATPENTVGPITNYVIVKKDGTTISVNEVVKLSAAQLVEKGIFS